MTAFEMVKYHKQDYPADIPLNIEECTAHFDTTSISSNLHRSLHTEYSYGKRKFDSSILARFPELRSAQRNGVPQLWSSEEWATEFVQFIVELSDGAKPAVIEVHPPFTDYTNFEGFISIYTVFEARMLDAFPDVQLLIENRCGSLYKGGRFLISKNPDVEMLCNSIVRHDLRLKIAYDIPQIYTAHNAKTESQYISLLEEAREFRTLIGGIHLWGKRTSDSGRRVSHCGDLTSYFEGNMKIKKLFLQSFIACFDDGVARKMVLEVNSGNDDLHSIVSDLQSHGAVFV